MKITSLSLLLPIVLAAAPALAQKKKDDQLPPRTEAEILQTVKLPEGYEATVFARPPQGGYPTSVSAAIDGTIFVAVDENGSLGRDRNPEPSADAARRVPGKVVRMRDTDGDGHADEFKVFCEVESPRGVIWDGPSGTAPGTLYVMHPPNLTAYTDTDGDGVSDKQEDILTGLGFDLDFRGADHTTNGCRLAIDGFIYIAMGDYGCINARGKDGTTLTHRGGGIVRIRPDGTGLELVVEGTRNIYDVAVSPTLDIFTRDNTNDGGGWNVRLSFDPPGAHMGYPMLFKNFPEDMLQPLADLGGGSPCGALWLDEPGLPKGLFTVEWGAGGIMYHDDLVPDGAGWKLANQPATELDPASTHKRPPVQQKKWIAMTRPTDMDVDASGALYITSWEGATFNYNGPNAGYVLRVVKKDKPKVEVPDLAKATPEELANHVSSESATLRLAAQRSLLRRQRAAQQAFKITADLALTMTGYQGGNPGGVLGWLRSKVDSSSVPLSGRVAALHTYLLAASFSSDFQDAGCVFAQHSPKLVADRNLLAALAMAFGNEKRFAPAGTVELVTHALGSIEPRVRAAAITAIRRLGKTDAALAILPLVADADPVVAHLALRALRDLKAVQVCLGALDSSDDKVKAGALQALYGMYEPAVVEGLIARLPVAATPSSPVVSAALPPRGAVGSEGAARKTSDGGVAATALRRGILNALCRLANRDSPYESPTVWWGTRPDTGGPVYQPIAWAETPKISAALKSALDASTPDDAKWLVARMYECKVAFPGLVEMMLAKAGNDTVAKLTAIEGMIRADNSLPREGVSALQSIAINDKEAPELRIRALRVFQRCAENGSVFPGAMAAFAPLAGHDIADDKIKSAFEDFTRGSANGKWVGDFAKALADNDVQKRLLAATVLVNLSIGKVGKEQERDAAKKAVEKGWSKPESAAALLTAIARTGAKALAAQVKAHLNDPNNAVAESALFAYQKLGLKEETKPSKTIGEIKYDDLFAAVQKGGDAKAGQEMYLRAGCIACHTIQPDEPPKGPILSAVAKIYDRAALTESILKPSAKIAQGFESTWITTKKGEQIEGFVTREGGDSVDVRNIAGQTMTIEKGDITERGTRPQSIMPEGLLNAFTPAELSNLLAWLESLKK